MLRELSVGQNFSNFEAWILIFCVVLIIHVRNISIDPGFIYLRANNFLSMRAAKLSVIVLQFSGDFLRSLCPGSSPSCASKTM